MGIQDYDRVVAPIIAFDRNLSPSIPIVSSDNFSGGIFAPQTLQKAGCHNPLMITGNDDSNSPTGLRQLGFTSILDEAKVFKIASDLSPVRKEMEIRSILEKYKPDGIFVSGDATAMLVWNVARSLKLSIPEDIKLIGYDGTSFIESYYPQLTTIKQPLVEIARLLVDLLIDKIEGKKLPKTDYILPITLLAGASV